ncbi:ketopantoate reductase family protein [Streptomyces sp. YIM B13518]|uniref:ketopantoate reductase family protein n=1 Tax=Streptomyces sp. YIM B13518 TaxID=3366316 RepID=UPI0036C74532
MSTTSPLAGAPSGRRWNIAVLGPGGVGGLPAGLLSRAGHRVVCVAGQDTVRTLRRDGLRVRSRQFGDFTAHVEADTEPREPVDLCLVTVKHTALDAALERVPDRALGDALVLPLLNGVEHLSVLRRRHSGRDVVAGTIRVASTRTAPGVVEHGSPFTEITLGGDGERPAPLASTLTEAGVRTTASDDETAVLWSKPAFLAPFALLTTRYGLTVGGIRTERREELTALVEETAAVSGACGAPADPARTLEMYDASPADNKSSMQHDAEAGRPLELDAIGGAVLRAAERHGVPVPVTARPMGELTAG